MPTGASGIEYYRAYDRARGARQNAEDIRKYRASNPNAYAAHVAVGNAVRDGKLEKPDACSCCGKSGRYPHPRAP